MHWISLRGRGAFDEDGVALELIDRVVAHTEYLAQHFTVVLPLPARTSTRAGLRIREAERRPREAKRSALVAHVDQRLALARPIGVGHMAQRLHLPDCEPGRAER